MGLSGEVLATAQIPYPLLTPTYGVSEQNALVVWDAFTKCIKRITSTLTQPPQAIGLSSAMHSIIPVNDSGIPLANMITWADSRASQYANKLLSTDDGRRLYEETGTPVHAMSPLCKLMWMRENKPDVFTAASKFISIKEFIWHSLFKCFEVDYSIASATGLFDIGTLQWHEHALNTAGISADRLSVPVNTNWSRSNINKDLADELNLPSDTSFIIGASDGCLANVGTKATAPGVAALTIGTSGAIRLANNHPIKNFPSMTFNYLLDDKTFICGGPVNNGGIALKWYAQNFLKLSLEREEDYDNLLQALDVVSPGSDGVLFLPYLLGERAPIWNSETCGVFFGITSRHKQEHFTRAVIEGIVFALYQIARSLETDSSPIKEVHISGGFVKSKAWVQLLADVLGKKLVLTNTDDASAIGAALMAIKALGLNSSFEENSSSEEVIVQPDMNVHKKYASRYFPFYERLYKSLHGDMKLFHDYQRSDANDK